MLNRLLVQIHPSPSFTTKSHAKINQERKLKPTAGWHLRADLNSDLDFSDP